jgi:hypothetical protein
VDNSCGYYDKLKCVVFSSSSDTSKTFSDVCEIGDIVRFHRLRIQEYMSKPQGVCTKSYTSWIRFKRQTSNFIYEGNKNSFVNEQDQEIVRFRVCF